MTPAPASLTVLNSAGIPEHTNVDLDAPFESDRDDILIPGTGPVSTGCSTASALAGQRLWASP